jgi:hypothetical protein
VAETEKFKMKFLFPLLLCLAGCALPLKPGHSSFVSPSGVTGTVQQSQNPKNETKQVYRRTQEGNKITEEVDTVIGAAQKDVAREIGAKLSSLKGVVWIGILVFLFGATSLVYPPLKVIVGGSVTTSAVIVLAGLALIVLPTLIVGNELLILGVALGAAALYFFAHRHASVHSKLKTLKGE